MGAETIITARGKPSLVQRLLTGTNGRRPNERAITPPQAIDTRLPIGGNMLLDLQIGREHNVSHQVYDRRHTWSVFGDICREYAVSGVEITRHTSPTNADKQPTKADEKVTIDFEGVNSLVDVCQADQRYTTINDLGRKAVSDWTERLLTENKNSYAATIAELEQARRELRILSQAPANRQYRNDHLPLLRLVNSAIGRLEADSHKVEKKRRWGKKEKLIGLGVGLLGIGLGYALSVGIGYAVASHEVPAISIFPDSAGDKGTNGSDSGQVLLPPLSATPRPSETATPPRTNTPEAPMAKNALELFFGDFLRVAIDARHQRAMAMTADEKERFFARIGGEEKLDSPCVVGTLIGLDTGEPYENPAHPVYDDVFGNRREGTINGGLADQVQAIIVCPSDKRIIQVSLFRDLRAPDIPRTADGRGGSTVNVAPYVKAFHPYHNGNPDEPDYHDPELTRTVLEDALGLPVDFIIRGNFDSFEEIFDRIFPEGLTLTLTPPESFKRLAGTEFEEDFPPGVPIVFNGAKALRYIRTRQLAQSHLACSGAGESALARENAFKIFFRQGFKQIAKSLISLDYQNRFDTMMSNLVDIVRLLESDQRQDLRLYSDITFEGRKLALADLLYFYHQAINKYTKGMLADTNKIGQLMKLLGQLEDLQFTNVSLGPEDMLALNPKFALMNAEGTGPGDFQDPSQENVLAYWARMRSHTADALAGTYVPPDPCAAAPAQEGQQQDGSDDQSKSPDRKPDNPASDAVPIAASLFATSISLADTLELRKKFPSRGKRPENGWLAQTAEEVSYLKQIAAHLESILAGPHDNGFYEAVRKLDRMKWWKRLDRVNSVEQRIFQELFLAVGLYASADPKLSHLPMCKEAIRRVKSRSARNKALLRQASDAMISPGRVDYPDLPAEKTILLSIATKVGAQLPHLQKALREFYQVEGPIVAGNILQYSPHQIAAGINS